MPPQTIIQQAAEAIIIREGNNVIKQRIAKNYRIKEIDEKLRKKRTRAEAKILEKLQNIINVPKLIKSDEKTKEIIMEFINGKKLSEHLDEFPIKEQEVICSEIGKEISKMHNHDIIHGDLTTSNMILVETLNKNNVKTPYLAKNSPQCANEPRVINSKKYNSEMPEQEEGMKEANLIKTNKSITKDKQIYFIDFGLAFHSKKIEDKAVDLHLIKQALESKHFSNWQTLFTAFLTGYNPQDKTQILKQLEKVELRGRYKKQ